MIRSMALLIGATGAIMSVPTDAHAYLDPGTASYFLQILIAVFVSVFFAVKHYWQKIKSIFSKILTETQTKQT